MFKTALRFVTLRSNIFLVLVIILGCMYAIIWNEQNVIDTQIINNQSEEEITKNVRITDRYTNAFYQINYSVELNGDSWNMSADKYLEIGKQYIITFVHQKASPVQIKILQSQSKKGSIKLVSVIQEYQVCGLTCQWYRQQYQARSWIEQQLIYGECVNLKYCSENRALGVGLVLGGTTYFDQNSKDQFKRYGLSHIVAVSGFQVTLMIAATEYWMQRFKVPKKIHYSIFVVEIILFILIIGLQPPILRAITTSIIIICSYALGRRITYIRALLLSIPVMLIIYPIFFYSLSWQLSLAATFGLIVLGNIINLLEIKSKLLYEIALQPVMAWLMTFPLTSFFQTTISPLSFIMNMIYAIVTPLLTVIHLVRLIPIVGVGADYIAHGVSYLLFESLRYADRNTYSIYIEEYSLSQLVWYYVIIALILCVMETILLCNRSKSRIKGISSLSFE